MKGLKMRTQKQQLLDYLEIHASEAELLDLCRKAKDNRVAVEYFLKDVATTDPKDTGQVQKHEYAPRIYKDRVLSVLGQYTIHTRLVAFYVSLSVEDTRQVLDHLLSEGRVQYFAPDSWSL